MEARDEKVRIRPLPPDPPEGTPPGGTARSPRRWLPLAVATGALVLVGVGVALLGGDTDSPVDGDGAGGAVATTTTTTTIPAFAEDAPSTTASPTTTVPPTLEGLLPGTESGLTAVFRDGRFGTVVHWEAKSTIPTFLPLTARPDLASFDASARWLAYLSFFRTDASLHLGLPATSQPAQFIGVSGAAWHPDDPLRIAWTAHLPTAETAYLYEGVADPNTQELMVTRQVAEVFPTEALVAWGEWGFLLERRSFLDPAYAVSVPLTQDPSSSRLVEFALVTALDLEGRRIATAPAAFLDATDEGKLLLASTVEAYEEVISNGEDLTGFGVDPAAVKPAPSGIFLADPELDLIAFTTSSPLLPERTHLLTTDGEHVIEAHQESGTITTYDLTGRGVQIVSLGRPADVVSLTPDGQFLVVQDTRGTGDLIFVDWQFGRIIPVPLGVGVAVAIDLR